MSNKKPWWVGVDLDGTLAKHTGDYRPGIVGDLVPSMKKVIEEHLTDGLIVKIMTARAHPGYCLQDNMDCVKDRHGIKDWLEANGLPPLEITYQKDRYMLTLYDDRAVQVEFNTGKLIGFSTLKLKKGYKEYKHN